MSQKVEVSGGIGVFGLLGVAFVVLKLCGVIDWSWWLVTLPLWWPLSFVLAVLLLVFVFTVLSRR